MQKRPKGFEPRYPAEAGKPSPLYAWPTGRTNIRYHPARRESDSELLGCCLPYLHAKYVWLL